MGDLMQRWTNDEWVSTLHRVAMPATDAMERRYSIAYFVNVNGDTVIGPLHQQQENQNQHNNYKYPLITARDHLMAKHLASMATTEQDNNDDGTTENKREEKDEL